MSPIVSKNNSTPIITLGLTSLGVTTVSAVALSLLIGSSPSALHALRSFEGIGALTLTTMGAAIFVGTCIWGIRRCQHRKQEIEKLRRLHNAKVAANALPKECISPKKLRRTRGPKFAEKQSPLEKEISALASTITGVLIQLRIKDTGTITAKEQELIQRAASDLSKMFLPQTTALGIDSASYLEKCNKLNVIRIPIPILGKMDIDHLKASGSKSPQDDNSLKRNMCTIVGEYLVDLCEMASICESIGDQDNAERIARVKALHTEFQEISSTASRQSQAALKGQLLEFVAKLPVPTTLVDTWNLTPERLEGLANALPDNHVGKTKYKKAKVLAENMAREIELSAGFLDSNLDKLVRIEADFIAKARKINLCCGVLTYITDLKNINRILVLADKASKESEISGYFAQLQLIIDRIPTSSEEEIRFALQTFISTLRSPEMIWGEDLLTTKCSDEEGQFLLPYIKTILKDIRHKKDLVLPGRVSDTINHPAILNGAFEKVMPYLELRISPQEFLLMIAHQILPAVNRSLAQDNFSASSKGFLQLLKWMQSLLVIPFSRSKDVSIEFDVTQFGLSQLQTYKSVDTPGGSLLSGAGTTESVLNFLNEMSWRKLSFAMGLTFTQSQIAVDAPPLITAMMSTLFPLIRPGEKLNRQVMPILKDTASLQAKLVAEAAKPQVDFTSVLAHVTKHFREVSQKIPFIE